MKRVPRLVCHYPWVAMFLWSVVGAMWQFWVFVRKLQESKQDSRDLSVFQALLLACVFVLLLGIADRRALTLAHPLQLAVAGLCTSVQMCFLHMRLGLVTARFSQVIPLNPQSTNCPMCWVKLAIAQDISSLHLPAPFPQVPPTLEQ